MRVAKPIELDTQTDRELRALALGKRVEVRLQQRARIVMLAAKGMQNRDIALEVGLDRRQVALWRERFIGGGIEAIRKDAPRAGRPAIVMQKMESCIVQTTLNEMPTDATHWSTRTLAAHLGGGRDHRTQGLAQQRVEAASDPFLQAFERSALRRQAAGRGRPVPESSRACAGPQLRREEPDSGARSHAAWPADEGWARRHGHPRLQAPRYDHAVCRAEHAGWQRDLNVPASPPSHRVAQVPGAHRSQHAQSI